MVVISGISFSISQKSVTKFILKLGLWFRGKVEITAHLNYKTEIYKIILR